MLTITVDVGNRNWKKNMTWQDIGGKSGKSGAFESQGVLITLQRTRKVQIRKL